MNSTPEPQSTDYDGCNRKCRLAAAHTLVWGECEHGVEPEPTVSLSRVYTATDGFPAIGFDSYTVAALADLIEPALRRVHARLGPNALAMLHRGETVSLSGGEYADLAREAAHAIVHRNAAAAAAPVAVPPTVERHAAPIDWVDGHPQLEAIAAAVWEKCRRTDSGGCVDDDPRNIAVAAYAAALAAAVPSAPATQAADVDRRDRYAQAIREATGERWPGQAFWTEADAVLAVADAEQTDTRAAALREAAEAVLALDYDEVVGEVGDQNISDIREAWNLGTIDATDLLRRMAAEAQPETQAGHDGPHMMRPTYRTRPGDATVDPATCPQCKGDNSEAFALCDRCAATAPAVVSQPDEEAYVPTLHGAAELEEKLDIDVSPAAVLLSTRCDACRHTLNWHRNDVGCTVALCVCGRFQPPAEEPSP